MKLFSPSILIFTIVFLLSGCGYFKDRATQSVNLAPAINMVVVDTEKINFMIDTIGAHAGDYDDEALKALLKAQGSLQSLLSYANMLATKGQANVCNTETVWDMAQIDYYTLVKTIDTKTWTRAEKIIFQSTIEDASRLANVIDLMLKEAGDNATRANMDVILGQLVNWVGVAAPLL